MELETAEKTKALCNDKAFVEKFMDDLFEQLTAGGANPEQLAKLQEQMQEKFLPSKKFLTELQTQSAKILETAMKKTGVIPQNASVQVNHLGQGAFGNAYKVSFLDEAGQKLFHDKVLKVYKDPKIAAETASNMSSEILNYYKSMTKEQYVAKIEAAFDKIPGIPEDMKSLMKASLGEQYEQMKNMPDEQIKETINMMMGGGNSYHGAGAEANAATFVKKAIGHRLEKSDLAQPHFFDLDANIALTEMSDDALATITKKTDFSKLGLTHGDIAMNSNNTVNRKIIDYGGIIVNNDILAKSKVARRIYKKIAALTSKSPERTTQMKIDLWNRYYDLANKNKIGQSHDVLDGLKEARNLIDESQWDKLHGDFPKRTKNFGIYFSEIFNVVKNNQLK